MQPSNLVQQLRSYHTSQRLYERASQVLAGGVSSEFRKFSQPHPLFYSHASGTRITDVDGNEYLDFALSQGPMILGHSHPAVLKRVQEYSANGQLFAGQHLLELELAETLQRSIPCAERIRFSLSGSEADHAALRLARAHTSRQKFIRFEGHYHGWFDNVALGISAPSLEAAGDRLNPHPHPWTGGLPERAADEFIFLPWNDLTAVEGTLAAHQHEVAAIITEPIMCNNGCIEPKPGFLAGLRSLCDLYDVVLIFDEVITGFRLGMGGAQQCMGVIPDLAVFGKAMASGYPISVLAGKRAIMQHLADGTVIHAGTMNSGNPSIAAAVSTLTELGKPGVYDRLAELGQRLMAKLRQAAQQTGHQLLVQGPGPMFHCGFSPLARVDDFRDSLSYDKPKYAAFVRAMQERGVRLIGRGLWYISTAHSEADIDHAAAQAYAALAGLRA